MSVSLHGLDVIIGAVTSSKRTVAKNRLNASGARAVMTGNKLIAASKSAKRGKARANTLRAGNKLVHSGGKARSQATVLGGLTMRYALPPAPGTPGSGSIPSSPLPTPTTSTTRSGTFSTYVAPVMAVRNVAPPPPPVPTTTPSGETVLTSQQLAQQQDPNRVSAAERQTVPVQDRADYSLRTDGSAAAAFANYMTSQTTANPSTSTSSTFRPSDADVKASLASRYGAARSTVTPVITMTESMANQRANALDIAWQAGELGNLIVALIERLDAAGLVSVGDIGMALLDRINLVIDQYDPDAPSPDLSSELSSIRADYQKWSADAETQLRIAAAPIATPEVPTSAAPAEGSTAAPTGENYFMEQPGPSTSEDMVDWGDESHYERDMRQFEEMVPRSSDEDSGQVDWEQESDVTPLYTEDFEQDDTDVYEHDATEEAEGDGLVERAATDLEGIYGDAVLPTWQKAGMIAGVFGLALGGTMLFSNAMARR